MDSDAVYMADLWVKAQRPLDTAKTHGKWENPMTHVHFSLKKDLGSNPMA
jgi:hypothetical protein